MFARTANAEGSIAVSAERVCPMSSTRPTARIARTYRFEAAHYLPLLPATHKCHRLHGHNYRVMITVVGELDERGFVADFAELDAEVEQLIAIVDHKLLNDIQGLENPTAELIAFWFIERLPGCQTVRVYENDDSWGEVVRD